MKFCGNEIFNLNIANKEINKKVEIKHTIETLVFLVKSIDVSYLICFFLVLNLFIYLFMLFFNIIFDID